MKTFHMNGQFSDVQILEYMYLLIGKLLRRCKIPDSNDYMFECLQLSRERSLMLTVNCQSGLAKLKQTRVTM